MNSRTRTVLFLAVFIGCCSSLQAGNLVIRVWNCTGTPFGQFGSGDQQNVLALSGPGFSPYVNGPTNGPYAEFGPYCDPGVYTLQHWCYYDGQPDHIPLRYTVTSGSLGGHCNDGGGDQLWNWFVFSDGCPMCAPSNVSKVEDGSDGARKRPRSDDCGMPVWEVSEPYISLWLYDEPLGYQPALGPRISFELAYKQRESTGGLSTNIFGAGKKWNCSWLSYVSQDTNGSNVVYFSGGGQRTFLGTNDYLTNTRLTGDTNNGFTLAYPDGSSNVYGFIVTNSSGTFLKAFLSEMRNPQSQVTRFVYSSYDNTSPVIRLQSVVDGDGHSTSLAYVTANGFSTNLISQVTDPFGRTASLYYDDNGHLTNIIDVAGISSAFGYDTHDWTTNLTTPYGTTAFSLTDTTGTNVVPNGRSVLVTEPDGNHQLFLYQDSAPGVPDSYANTSQVPGTSAFSNTFETLGLSVRNSFHWGRRQYAALSTSDVSAFTSNDFRKARMQHWLRSATNEVGETVSLQRQPSPDSIGAVDGQKTWYDYAAKPSGSMIGNQMLPLFVASVLPGGTSHFVREDRNNLGLPTRTVETWSASAGGTVLLRTNTFTYSTNSIDLLAANNALGVQLSSNVYNAYHQVLTNYNALNEKTVYAYNTNRQVTSISRPSGLITTNIYFQSDEARNFLDRSIDYAAVEGATVNYRTNSFTWADGLIQTHTDPRGLNVAYTWDSLQRPTRLDFPDGTLVTNTYDKLDLVRVVDRMGFTNSFDYNSVRQMTRAVNPRGVVTLYEYCSCGSLETVTNAFGTPEQQVTRYYYDLQGNLTQTVAPDNYTVTRNYNSLGQVTNVTDGTTSITNYYNNQGLLAASFNAFGQIAAATYDIVDRAISTVDANGVTVTNAFDELNRLLSKGYPDGGVVNLGYTFNVAGVTSYTNQLGINVVKYAYDPFGRKRSEMYPGISTNSFSYGGAGDLLTLTDGKNQNTSWSYDEYGRTTRKLDANGAEMFRYDYDANNRLTYRWTPEKGNTAYTLDAAGNCLAIHYPQSTITFGYGPLNRQTNMVDAVGTTKFTYNTAGQLETEDGPWDDDTVTYSYQNRLRRALSLAQPNTSAWVQSYGYDTANRLTNITSVAGSFGYTYDPARHLRVGRVSLPNAAYISSSYDSVSRLLETDLKNSGGNVLDGYGYGYNLAGQRTSVSRSVATANSSLALTYDPIGQLKAALGREADNTPRLHEQFGYSYDPAGNLNWRTNNALVQTLSVNNLNELAAITRNGTLTVAGNTTTAATNVTVNGLSADRYADNTFARDGFTPTDGTNTFTAVAQSPIGLLATNQIALSLPATNGFLYDLNGNLLSDGVRGFDYDDENQVIHITSTNNWKSEFVYDGQHRRRIERDYSWSGSAWTQTNETRFVYDGALVVQHRDASNTPVLTLTRGLDLSGSLQGAGGIGGLLSMTESSGTHTYYHADGSGNVTCLINANQLIIGQYAFDAFGRTLFARGPKALLNPYRFSSKPVHFYSGMYEFLYRWYAPELQRWPNHDPIGENGGINLYRFVGNNPINYLDPLGLDWQRDMVVGSWTFSGTVLGGIAGFFGGGGGGAVAGLGVASIATAPAGAVAGAALVGTAGGVVGNQIGNYIANSLGLGGGGGNQGKGGGIVPAMMVVAVRGLSFLERDSCPKPLSAPWNNFTERSSRIFCRICSRNFRSN